MWSLVWNNADYVEYIYIYNIRTNNSIDPVNLMNIQTIISRRVWRYQRGNQNPYIEEEQTAQWPKEKVQKDKQRSTKHTYKTKDRATRTPLRTGDEPGCSGRVSRSCSTSGIRRVNLVTIPVIGNNKHGT